MDKYQELEKRIKALEDNQIKVIMTRNADMNVYRAVQRALTQNNLAMGPSGASATASMILVLNSTTKAFVPPRMTTAQRDAIVSPIEGMLIYNTSTHALNDYNGSAWGAV